MEILVLDGKSYVKASKAAKDLGYATDYVGQLCRSGQVDAHLIGRTWYVNQDELSTHRTEKKRMSRTKAREYAKKSIEEHRIKITNGTNVYKNIGIQYEHDEQPLLPETKKLSIKSEPVKREYAYEERVEGDEREVLNKGEHVVMSGDIKVIDVTDGIIDRDTTVLKPRMIHTRPAEVIDMHKEDHEEPVEETEYSEELLESDVQQEDTPKKMSFIERLENTDSLESAENETTPTLPQNIDTTMVVRPTMFSCVTISVLILLLGVCSIMVTQDISYTHLGGTTAIEETSYSLTLQNLIDIVSLKI